MYRDDSSIHRTVDDQHLKHALSVCVCLGGCVRDIYVDVLWFT